jgi:hypothetical protein
MTWQEPKCRYDNDITCKYVSACKKECRYLKHDRRNKKRLKR